MTVALICGAGHPAVLPGGHRALLPGLHPRRVGSHSLCSRLAPSTLVWRRTDRLFLSFSPVGLRLISQWPLTSPRQTVSASTLQQVKLFSVRNLHRQSALIYYHRYHYLLLLSFPSVARSPCQIICHSSDLSSQPIRSLPVPAGRGGAALFIRSSINPTETLSLCMSDDLISVRRPNIPNAILWMLFPQLGIGGVPLPPPPLLESRRNLEVICHRNEVGQRFTCLKFVSSCSVFGFITAWKLMSVQNDSV